MNPDLIISPIVGGFIGGFANWLAIQMLFYPLNEKRFLGIRIPFTPGLIPKERKRIAQGIADAVSNYFLSEEAIMEAVISPRAERQFKNYIKNYIEEQRKSEKTIGQVVREVSDKELYEIFKKFEDNIVNFFYNQIKKEDFINAFSLYLNKVIDDFKDERIIDLFTDQEINAFKENTVDNVYRLLNSENTKNNIAHEIHTNIQNIKNSELQLKEIVSQETLDVIKSKVITNSDKVSDLIINYLYNPAVQFKLRKFIKNSFENSLKFKIVSKFISTERIFEKLYRELIEFLQEPESQKEIKNYIIKMIDSISEKQIKDIIYDYDIEITNEEIEIFIDKIVSCSFSKDFIDKLISKNTVDIEQKSIEQLVDMLDIKVFENKKEVAEKIVTRIVHNIKYEDLRSILYTLADKMSQQKINLFFKGLNDKDINLIQDIILKNYKKIINGESNRIFKILNISKIIEDKINDFDIGEMEEIMLRVIRKDIIVMRLFEAGIGFVIGFFIPLYPYIIDLIFNLFK